jgi:hypothetical protein
MMFSTNPHRLPTRITTKAEAVAAVESLFPQWDRAGQIVTDAHWAKDRKYGWEGKYQLHLHYDIERLIDKGIEDFVWWALDKNTRLYKKARATFTTLLVKKFIELTRANIAAVERHYDELHHYQRKEKAILAQYVFDGEGI